MIILYEMEVASNSINVQQRVESMLENNKFITIFKFALIDYMLICQILIIDIEIT
jgi:hypothetical protein